MNSAQQNYKVAEKELLLIVATLKELETFYEVNRSQSIVLTTKNLTYTNFTTEQVMRWRLVLGEFGLDLQQYVKGKKNIVADDLSRPEIDDDREICNTSECFGHDDNDLRPSSFPIRYKVIAKAQLDDPALLLELLSHKDYSKATFRGGNKDNKLICHYRKK
jgi:hypothetical protein